MTLVPPEVVTVRSTIPVDSAGDVAEQVVVVEQVTVVAAVDPKRAVVDPTTKPEPVTVTTVPPASGPAAGLIPVTVGMASKAKLSDAPMALVPPGVVTVRSTNPAVSGGEVAEQVVVVEQDTEVPAVDPKLAVVDPTTKPVPVTVTEVPPATGPAVGLIPVTVGALWNAKSSADDGLEVPPGVETVRSTIPADSAGEVTEQVVVVEQVTAVAAVDPKLAVVDPTTKPVPVTVTAVPPPSGPEIGLMAVTTGTATAGMAVMVMPLGAVPTLMAWVMLLVAVLMTVTVVEALLGT
jgi:hypothetical protein